MKPIANFVLPIPASLMLGAGQAPAVLVSLACCAAAADPGV